MVEPAGFLTREGLERLIEVLARHHRVYGPQVRDGAIVLAPLARDSRLPVGVALDAGPGRAELRHTDSPRQFDWVVGPQAVKPLLFAPIQPLWGWTRGEDGRLAFRPVTPEAESLAVIGVRACDLAALRLTDAHFVEGPAIDPHYCAAREALFLVAVNCARPAATCFCAATGDGPSANAGFDLLLDELDAGFLVTIGSDRGAELLADIDLSPVSEQQRKEARLQRRQAVAAQTRRLPDAPLSGLARQRTSAHWERVAERCLACGNCTAVCPTCFCHRQRAESDLAGQGGKTDRVWDSCFSPGHSLLGGRPLRGDTAARYRQWLTHKFCDWETQYGRSGCVGCGRCIAWCPVGIDVTEELASLLEQPS
ncbi:4Fe-4S dicluster domain-containing protein [Thiohalobacter sp.]|uniref:4Fe-4S dicluster domain-containing protein n=1 Tax=Thiohalobacter sp. TaxID=2025948 RepID=UPI002626D233|nr:4Fe-4S dicluster domain-containing protein [Thiohalobacter sp.]